MVQSDESVVRTVGLTKIFRDFWLREKVTAVAGLDMEILPKEVFGLLGPNGSGKSTTLKMILGLLFPTRGTIGVFARHPTNVAVKSRIGFLPEESYLYPFLDARETLDFYGRLFHLPRRQRLRRIDMLLDMVGLTAVSYRRVGEYSKGMQRRIGLAQALINDPDLLILDEPTSGLDPLGTKQFKDLIRTLTLRGKTVILSSHLLGDVEDVCDRICILYGGRQQATGSIDDLLARKQRTQIITDKLDEQTLAQLRTLLEKHKKELIEITSPRDRLETLFLRIVQQARQQRLATSGSTSDGKLAEFLTAGEGDQGHRLIQSLLEAAQEPESPVAQQAEEPSENEIKADADVLAELISDTATEQPEKSPAQAMPNDKQIDHGIIDNLIDNSKGKASSNE